jgi:PilZ domain
VKREDVLQQAQQASLPEPGPHAAVEEAAEKRQHPRVPVSVGVEIVEPKTRVRITGRATDFGVGGCYVDTMTTFAPGTAVDVLLHWQGRTLHLHALVSYAVNSRSIGMGLSFTRMSAEEGTTLLDWVTGLGSEPFQNKLREPEHAVEPSGETKLMSTNHLESVIHDLVTLLMRKQVLTEKEGAELRKRISA